MLHEKEERSQTNHLNSYINKMEIDKQNKLKVFRRKEIMMREINKIEKNTKINETESTLIIISFKVQINICRTI